MEPKGSLRIRENLPLDPYYSWITAVQTSMIRFNIILPYTVASKYVIPNYWLMNASVVWHTAGVLFRCNFFFLPL